MLSLNAESHWSIRFLQVAWTQPGYLYRYFVWGAQRLISSRSDDYRRYGYHTIDKAPIAFHFAQGKPAGPSGEG